MVRAFFGDFFCVLKLPSVTGGDAGKLLLFSLVIFSGILAPSNAIVFFTSGIDSRSEKSTLEAPRYALITIPTINVQRVRSGLKRPPSLRGARMAEDICGSFLSPSTAIVLCKKKKNL